MKNEDIRDIQVMEDFSFINAPYDAAEHILRIFGKSRNGEKPIITKARKDEKAKKKSTESTSKKETVSKTRKDNGPKKEKRTRDYSMEEAEFLEYQRAWNEERERKGKGRKAKASSSKKASSKPKSKSKRGRR